MTVIRPGKYRDDYTTRDGAERLRARIAEYWQRQNLAPQLMTSLAPGCEPERGPHFDIRSDMIDGLPRQAWRKAPPRFAALRGDARAPQAKPPSSVIPPYAPEEGGAAIQDVAR